MSRGEGRGEGYEVGIDRFEELRLRGVEALHAGQLETAEADFDAALRWARERGDEERAALALCNRAAVAIALGHGEPEIAGQREILVRDGVRVTCHLAAFNIAQQYELSKDFKKSLFYARIALQHAVAVERRDWLPGCHNQIGNALLAQSHLADAEREYERALALLPADAGVPRAQVLGNLGYCHVLGGRMGTGYRLLYQALRCFLRAGAERAAIVARLDLCFAHLETGRLRDARRHGLAALRLAEEIGHPDGLKNALYLLGEEASLRGDVDEAAAHYRRLQKTFYPDNPDLTRFLLSVDVRRMINLHA
jgi:tetratricopeptide (TPR) repeat protein